MLLFVAEISNTLLFPQIEKTDNGTYTCFVFNGIGQEKNESVFLDVQCKLFAILYSDNNIQVFKMF